MLKQSPPRPAGALLLALGEGVADGEAEATAGPAGALLLAPGEEGWDPITEAAGGAAAAWILAADSSTMAGGGAARLSSNSERPV